MTNRDVLVLVSTLRRELNKLSGPVATIPEMDKWRSALDSLMTMGETLASAEVTCFHDMSLNEWDEWNTEKANV